MLVLNNVKKTAHAYVIVFKYYRHLFLRVCKQISNCFIEKNTNPYMRRYCRYNIRLMSSKCFGVVVATW